MEYLLPLLCFILNICTKYIDFICKNLNTSYDYNNLSLSEWHFLKYHKTNQQSCHAWGWIFKCKWDPCSNLFTFVFGKTNETSRSSIIFHDQVTSIQCAIYYNLRCLSVGSCNSFWWLFYNTNSLHRPHKILSGLFFKLDFFFVLMGCRPTGLNNVFFVWILWTFLSYSSPQVENRFWGASGELILRTEWALLLVPV